jgi:hypothetical protein
MTACDVLANELLRVRAVHGGWAADAPATGEEELLAGLRSGLTAMSMFAADNLLMSKLFLIGYVPLSLIIVVVRISAH